MKHLVTTLSIFLLSIGCSVMGQETVNQSKSDDQPMSSEQIQTNGQDVRVGDPWPLDTCVVSGQKLGSMGDPIVMQHKGREVRFCCEGCIGMFEKDPVKYLSAADEKIKEQQKEFYPLDHCIIDTAEPISVDESENYYSVVGNRLFVYCCPPCDKKVRAETDKYMALLDKAVIEKQKKDYPLDTCVISGQPLDSMGGPVNMVIANQLVQLCCAGCEKKVEADPVGTLKKINKARVSE